MKYISAAQWISILAVLLCLGAVITLQRQCGQSVEQLFRALDGVPATSGPAQPDGAQPAQPDGG